MHPQTGGCDTESNLVEHRVTMHAVLAITLRTIEWEPEYARIHKIFSKCIKQILRLVKNSLGQVAVHCDHSASHLSLKVKLLTALVWD